MKHFDYIPLVIFSLHEGHAQPAGSTIVEGCYKGECEPAYMMLAETFYASDLAATLAADGQECLLYLDNQRSAWLRYGPSYDEEHGRYIGRWREVSPLQAGRYQSYTAYHGRYFAAS